MKLPPRYSQMTPDANMTGDGIAADLLKQRATKLDTMYHEADIDPLKLLRPGILSWKDADIRRQPIFNVKESAIAAMASGEMNRNIMPSLGKKYDERAGRGRYSEEFTMHKANVALKAANEAHSAAETAKVAAKVAASQVSGEVAEKAAATAVKAAAKAQASATTAVEVAKEAVAVATEKKDKELKGWGSWEEFNGWTKEISGLGDEPASTASTASKATALPTVPTNTISEDGGTMKRILCCLACIAVGVGVGVYLSKNAIV